MMPWNGGRIRGVGSVLISILEGVRRAGGRSGFRLFNSPQPAALMEGKEIAPPEFVVTDEPIIRL